MVGLVVVSFTPRALDVLYSSVIVKYCLCDSVAIVVVGAILSDSEVPCVSDSSQIPTHVSSVCPGEVV